MDCLAILIESGKIGQSNAEAFKRIVKSIGLHRYEYMGMGIAMSKTFHPQAFN